MGAQPRKETIDDSIAECSEILEKAGLQVKIKGDGRSESSGILSTRENGTCIVMPVENESLTLRTDLIGTEYYVDLNGEPAYIRDKDASELLKIYKSHSNSAKVKYNGWENKPLSKEVTYG